MDNSLNDVIDRYNQHRTAILFKKMDYVRYADGLTFILGLYGSKE